ncbi:MAG: BrnT family toxin [Paludibacterium sp.]|uniref:BrnT family toxin n=1 Tax=Paludibacterium sp. TaxID=1917523 RepID=UPI00344DA037|nr:BrnT family toxin [Paludibacterium sp.]MBV8648905.1 BrnT family toxin [Paludibacterium sp.]
MVECGIYFYRVALLLLWDTALITQDGRRDYGEARSIAYAIWGARLYCVVYTDRGRSRRIISLRKANKREAAFYAANN